VKYLLILLLVAQSAWAECDFSKIKKNENGDFIYTRELHLCVGVLVEQEKIRKEQVEVLGKALELKDLAIIRTETRAEMWRETSYKLEDRINTQAKYSSYRDWAFVGLGVLITGFSVYLSGQVYRR
jgi:hypothetical protein